MKKRFLAGALALSLLLAALPGCAGEGPQTTPTTVPQTTAAPTTEPVPTTHPTTEPKTLPETQPTEETVPPETEPDYDFSLSEESIVLTEKGQSMALYCGDVALNEISWFSDDESVALFSQGVVVALNAGETVVRAQYRDEVISCKVICDVDPEAPAPYVAPALLQSPRLGIPYVEDPSDTSFFDDAAFIGDSVSYVLQQWNLQHGNFGNAVFLARSSLGLQNTIDGRLTLNYQGVSYSPEDALTAAGAKKLFVMLGFNDLNLFGIDGTLERWDIFLERILEKNPGIQIYIQSCTPVHKDGQAGALNNDTIDAYNEALENYCQEHGYFYVDVASYMKDYRNSLVPAYCSDGKMHITYDGAVVWEAALKAYAEQQRRNMEGENE